jgi:hypothetical protein
VLLNLAVLHARGRDAAGAEKCLGEAAGAVAESGEAPLEGWLLKYRGYAALLREEFDPATEQFRGAAGAFGRADNPREQARCEALALFAVAPGVCRGVEEYAPHWREALGLLSRVGPWGEEIGERFRHAFALLDEIEGLVAASRGQAVPDDGVVQRVAAAVEELLRCVQAVSNPEAVARLAQAARGVFEGEVIARHVEHLRAILAAARGDGLLDRLRRLEGDLRELHSRLAADLGRREAAWAESEIQRLMSLVRECLHAAGHLHSIVETDFWPGPWRR